MSFLLRVENLRRLSTLLLVGSAIVTAACESSPAVTTPSGVLQVTAPASTLKTGDTVTLSVASGGAAVTSVAWTSSDGSVAAVSATGVVTARRSGRATITAATSTAAGQVSLRVVPDFAGTWSGPLLRLLPSCAPASTATVCLPSTTPEMLRAPITLQLTQSGGTVTGTLIDGLESALVVPLTGQVDAADALTLEGRSVPPALPAAQRRQTVASFRATYDPTVQTLSGSFVQIVEQAGATGTFVTDYSLQAQFRDITRR